MNRHCLFPRQKRRGAAHVAHMEAWQTAKLPTWSMRVVILGAARVLGQRKRRGQSEQLEHFRLTESSVVRPLAAFLLLQFLPVPAILNWSATEVHHVYSASSFPTARPLCVAFPIRLLPCRCKKQNKWKNFSISQIGYRSLNRNEIMIHKKFNSIQRTKDKIHTRRNVRKSQIPTEQKVQFNKKKPQNNNPFKSTIPSNYPSFIFTSIRLSINTTKSHRHFQYNSQQQYTVINIVPPPESLAAP